MLKIARDKNKDQKVLFITEDKREFLQQFDQLSQSLQQDVMRLVEKSINPRRANETNYPKKPETGWHDFQTSGL